ncbi:unnamed protein product [Tenebrio molitor]|nr:unnamed protein product [Tenebrio molitor]
MSVHSPLIYQSSFNNSAVSVTMNKFDWKSTIRTNLLMLRLTGLWPESDDGYKLDLYTFYAICAKLLADGNNIFQTAYIFEIYTDLQALASTFFVLCTYWLASVKVCFFVRKIKIIKSLMKELDCEDFQPRSEHQKIFLEPTLNSWRAIYAVFWTMVAPALLFLVFFPVIDGSARQYRLPFWAWYPYDTTTSPNYEISYFHQVFSIWFLAICNLNMDTLMAALMMYTVTQCDILCDNLRNIKGGDRGEKIIECVEHHKKILSFAKNSNTFFNEMVLGQFFTSSASMALGMFEFTLVDPLSSEGIWVAMYVGSVTVQIFLYCWFGNQVEERDLKYFYSAQKKNDSFTLSLEIHKGAIFDRLKINVIIQGFDWKSTIRTNLLMLRLTGLWPESDDGYKLDLYTFYAICAKVLSDGNNFFQTAYIFEIYTDLQALASTFFVLCTDWLASIKVYYFVRKIKTIKSLMKELDSEEFQPRNEQQKIFLEPTLNSWRAIYALFCTVAAPALLLLTLFPIIDGSARQYRLPYWAWYPYDTKTSPNYEISYFHQVFSIWFLAICNLNMDTLMAALMMYTVTQCDILCDNLRNIKSGDRGKKIIECVEHHKKILGFAKNSNIFFNEMVLGQFFTSSASVALGMFEFTLVDPLSSEGIWVAMYVGSVTVQIFLYCWFGNQVEERHRLPFFAWYPYDTTTSPLYEITYFYQIFSAGFLAVVCLNIDTLIAAVMVFTMSQCDILCDNLKNLSTCKDSGYSEKLINCIKHHQKILRFAQNSNQFFNEIALGQFFTSSASLAMALFQLTVVEALSSEFYSLLFYVASITSQIALYCWFGNEVEFRVSFELIFYKLC